MAVIAFLRSGQSVSSIVDHAIWAATQMNDAIRFVALAPGAETEPALVFDAYQGMDAREDLLRELVAAERRSAPDSQDEPWGVDIVQAAARTARERGLTAVHTEVSTERFHAYIDLLTDSTDLLVTAGPQLGFDLAQALKVRKRVFLLAPARFKPLESWLLAYSGDAGSGRAIEFLAGHSLLRTIDGTAVTVTNDDHTRLHFRDAVAHLESAGYKLTTHELHGNADDVLTAVLTVKPVDALVVGVSSPERLRSLFERGSAVKLVTHFSGPVVLARS